ncbi:MAG: hypothetical protein JSS02_03830 [Planctomycetes bacterium]|nr:hypothetical protein [Planctomycetota bacterium]
MEQLQKLGPLKQIMSSLSLNEKTTEMLANGDFDMVHDLKQIAGIIDSMTVQERQNPRLIDTNRRQRIAAGSGTKPTDIDTLIKEFLQMAWLMESMAKLSRRK